MAPATALSSGPADLIAYQNELVRTQQAIPLGRMQKIAVGPSANWQGSDDPWVRKFGRLIELRDRVLPIAQTTDRAMVLIMAPLRDRDEKGAPRLPDLPDPNWTPGAPTREEIEGTLVPDGHGGQKRVLIDNPAKVTAPMVPQRLTDRCEMMDGRPAVLTGTHFLIFQPVLRVSFQPEIQNRLVGTAWTLEFQPDESGRHCCLLIDHLTGESHFLYGKYDIASAGGE